MRLSTNLYRFIITGFFMSIFSLVSVSQNMQPKDTEVWENEPKVINPGNKHHPPSDAIVLFKNDLSEWESGNGEKAKWTVEDGFFTVKPGTGNIKTKRSFGDVQLHIEWRTPKADLSKKGQGRGNSGVFLQSQYEVQVLDSYENRTYSNGQAGSIYKQHVPLVNAMRPPMEWQVYDIIYKAPRFDSNGNLESPAYVTVLHNGVLIQNHVELKGPTVFVGHPEYNAHGDLPIMLQDHGNLISFRNIWVREL